MNPYIQSQIINMKACVELCQKNVHWAAKADDGKVSKSEKKVLSKLDRTVQRFLKDLDRIS